MAEQANITVGIVYALPDRQRQIRLSVAADSQARAAVLASGLDAEFPGLDLAACPIGIFGKRVSDTHSLQAGDRIEIYRPLPNDPHELRRERAQRDKAR